MKRNQLISKLWIAAMAFVAVGFLASTAMPNVILSDAAITQVRGGQGSGNCDQDLDVLDACFSPNGCDGVNPPNCGNGDCSAACTNAGAYWTLKAGDDYEYDGTPSVDCGNHRAGATCQTVSTICGCLGGMDNGMDCGDHVGLNNDLTRCG